MDNPCVPNEEMYKYADQLSCDAQTELAKQELLKNRYRNAYLAHRFADGRLNYDLIKPAPVGLKFCVDTPNISLFKSNDDKIWDEQFMLLPVKHDQPFDQFTRAKTCSSIE